MSTLSISNAWEETKDIVSRDGRLIATVAVALIALPATVNGLVAPQGLMADSSAPSWVILVTIIASLIAVAGQLALIRLAIGPSTTVGDAIVHGIRRMPIYVLAAILIGCALFIIALPFAGAAIAAGVPLDEEGLRQSPVGALLCLVYFALVVFVGVRMMMSSPVASAEAAGPIAIIRRSWELTRGNWWRLFAFLLLFLIAALVLLAAVGSAFGIVVGILLGKPDPLSAAALVIALVMGLVNAAVTGLFAVMLGRIYLQLSGASGSRARAPKSGD
jgi:hypothetical protein